MVKVISSAFNTITLYIYPKFTSVINISKKFKEFEMKYKYTSPRSMKCIYMIKEILETDIIHLKLIVLLGSVSMQISNLTLNSNFYQAITNTQYNGVIKNYMQTNLLSSIAKSTYSCLNFLFTFNLFEY